MRFDREDYTVIVNSPLQMSCEANGLPPPVISWNRDGAEINSSATEGTRLLSNGALRFNRVRLEDAGRYECVASNVAGRASRMVTLSVHGKS
jgi:hemicentin